MNTLIICFVFSFKLCNNIQIWFKELYEKLSLYYCILIYFYFENIANLKNVNLDVTTVFLHQDCYTGFNRSLKNKISLATKSRRSMFQPDSMKVDNKHLKYNNLINKQLL